MKVLTVARMLAIAAALALPLAAQAQSWREFTYPADGFAVQFPATPTVATGDYRMGAQSLPANTYSATLDGVSYSVVVADFSRTTVDDQTAMNEAIKTLKETGEIKVDSQERIDRSYGHDITLAGRDGSHSAVAVFFVDHRLYLLTGKAPNAEAGSARTARFQQTLTFVDAAGRAPRRPEDAGPGGGGGGRGGRGGRGGPEGGGPGGGRGPPPQQAYDDCKGKAEGAQVKHRTPQGLVDATCFQTPNGLAARPN